MFMYPELDFDCGEYASTFELSNFSLLRPYLSFVRVTWQHTVTAQHGSFSVFTYVTWTK